MLNICDSLVGNTGKMKMNKKKEKVHKMSGFSLDVSIFANLNEGKNHKKIGNGFF